MKKFTGMVERFSREMDKMAGFCIVGVMILVVANILLRKIFKLPILGSYELVGYLSALAASLALASCALQNGHIALDYIVNKFPGKIQTVTSIFVNFIALCFWGFTAWHLGIYAQNLMVNGVVSPTAQLPVYPVVLLIGFGLVGLCLVSIVRLFECSGTLLAGMPVALPRESGYVEDVRKAVR